MRLKITVDGKVYEVDVDASEPEQQQRRAAPKGGAAPRAFPTGPSPSPPTASADAPVNDESKVCRSPVAGVVVKLSAQVDQTIQANDVLMVLEAMKMETSISSPVAGKVARVNVGVGDPVKGGQVLVEFH